MLLAGQFRDGKSAYFSGSAVGHQNIMASDTKPPLFCEILSSDANNFDDFYGEQDLLPNFTNSQFLEEMDKKIESDNDFIFMIRALELEGIDEQQSLPIFTTAGISAQNADTKNFPIENSEDLIKALESLNNFEAGINLPVQFSQVSNIVEVDLLKPNPNHTKYVSKLTKPTKQLEVKREINTIAWNGTTDQDAIDIKALARQDYSRSVESTKNKKDFARLEAFRKKQLRTSKKKSKKEFTFDRDGNPTFQGPAPTYDVILDYLSLVALFFRNVAARPTFLGFAENLYFIIRAIHGPIHLTTVFSFIKKRFQSFQESLYDYKPTKAEIAQFVAFCEMEKPTMCPQFGIISKDVSFSKLYTMWKTYYDQNVEKFPLYFELPPVENFGFPTEIPIYSDYVEAFALYVHMRESRNTGVTTTICASYQLMHTFVTGFHFPEYHARVFFHVLDEPTKIKEIIKANFEKVVIQPASMTREQLSKMFDDTQEDDTPKDFLPHEIGHTVPADLGFFDDIEEDDEHYEGPSLQGPKEDLFKKFLQSAFPKDENVMDNSEFGRESKRLVSSFTLAPFVYASGNIASMDKYDEWYRKKFGNADVIGTQAIALGSWLYQFLKSGLPYMITGNTIYLNPIKDYERWLEISTSLFTELSTKSILQSLGSSYTQKQINTVVASLIKSGRDLLRNLSMLPVVQTRMLSVIAQLQTCYSIIHAHYRMQESKTQPVCVMFVGHSSIGKSTLMKLIAAVAASNLNIKAAANIYNIDSTSKFMDSYSEQRIGIIDDIGSGIPEVSPDLFSAKICQLVSDINTFTNQAALPDKGKIKNNFDVLIASTNDPLAGFQRVTVNPAAALRRFGFYIRSSVRKEYLLPGSETMLDNSKFNGDAIYEANLHDVCKPMAISSKLASFPYHTFDFEDGRGPRDTKDLSTHEMLRFFKAYHADFIVRSAKVKDASELILRSGWCDEHQTLDSHCGCVAQEPVEPMSLETSFELMPEVLNFDFAQFEAVKTQSNVLRALLSTYSEPKAPIVKKNFFHYLEKPLPELQGPRWDKFSKGVRSTLFYPIRSCVRSVIEDNAIQNSISVAVNSRVNEVVSMFTQEQPVTTAMDNVSHVPSVVSKIKDLRASIRNDIYKAIPMLGLGILAFLATYKSMELFIKYILMKPKPTLQGAGNFPERPPEAYAQVYKTIDAQFGVLKNDRPMFPQTRNPIKVLPTLETKRLQLQQVPNAINLITSNMAFVQRVAPAGVQEFGNIFGLFMGGNVLFMNAHYFEDLPYDQAFVYAIDVPTINGASRRFNINLTSRNVYKFEDRDLVAFNVTSCPAKCRIRKFIKQADDSIFKTQDAAIMTPSGPQKASITTEKYIYKEQNFHIYNSPHKTQKGDCGLPVYSNEEFHGLYGLHSGAWANNDDKLVVRIYETDYDEAVKGLLELGNAVTPLSAPVSSRSLDALSLQGLPDKSAFHHVRGHAYPIGAMPTGTGKPTSKVRKSMIASEMECLKVAPSFAYTTNPDMSFVNYNLFKLRAIEDSPRMINAELLLVGVQELEKTMTSWIDWDNVRMGSFDDALNGQPGTVSGSMNLSTSAGIGYAEQLKRDLVYENTGNNDRVFKEKVFNNILTMLWGYVNGETEFPLSRWFPKDEPITPEKEAAGRQRVVSSTPIHKLAVAKLVLKHIFLEMRHGGKAHMAVGINPASAEWSKIPEKFAKFDPKFERIVDSDYVFYDAYIWFLSHVLGIFLRKLKNNKYFNTKIHIKYEQFDFEITGLQILEGIAGDMMQYIAVVDGVAILLVDVIESGAEGTAELNSLMESLVHILIYIMTFMKSQESTDNDAKLVGIRKCVEQMPPFEENVALVNYGDDNADTCREEVSSFYNPEARSVAAAQLGFPITDARKNPTLCYVPLEKATFLKRRFAWNEEAQAYFAPLEESSIIKMLSYVKGNSNTLAVLTVNNTTSAVREYSMYGRTVYDEKKVYLMGLLSKHDLVRFLPNSWASFDDILEQFKADTLDMLT